AGRLVAGLRTGPRRAGLAAAHRDSGFAAGSRHDVADGHDRPGPVHHSATRLVLEDCARLPFAGALIPRGPVLPAPCPGSSAIGLALGMDAGCVGARGSVAVAR